MFEILIARGGALRTPWSHCEHVLCGLKAPPLSTRAGAPHGSRNWGTKKWRHEGGIIHDFFKLSESVRFGKADPPPETLHTLDAGGAEHLGGLHDGRDQSADAACLDEG